MKILAKLTPLLILALLPATAFAAEFAADQTLSFSQSIDDNLFAAGQTIIVNEPVMGDLFIGGQNIQVKAPVEENLFVGGQNMIITGEVGRDLFAAGDTLTLSASVAGDVYFAGNQIVIDQGVTVGGDLSAAGATIKILGQVTGGVDLNADNVEVAGEIEGSAAIRAGRSLTFSEEGSIGGDLDLTALENVPVEKVGGAVDFEELILTEEHPIKSFSQKVKENAQEFINKLRTFGFISGLVLAILLTLTMKVFVIRFSENGRQKFWSSLGLGFIVMAALPVCAAILAFTVIGLPLAGIVFLSIPVLTIFIYLTDSFIIGHLILPISTKSPTWRIILSYFIGILILTLISTLGIIGTLVQLLVFFVGVGSLARIQAEYFRVLQRAKKL